MNISMPLFSPVMHTTKAFCFGWFRAVFYRTFHAIIITLIINGCAADPIQLPDFEEAARSDEQVTDPVALIELCEIPWNSADCWQRLDVFEDIAIGNTETAQLNADIARDSDLAYDFILSGAKRQQQIAQIREDMLQAERKDHFLDNLWHRGVIVLIGLGAAL